MPTVMQVSGYRFFFYSLEGLEPPHREILTIARRIGGVLRFSRPRVEPDPRFGDTTLLNIQGGLGWALWH